MVVAPTIDQAQKIFLAFEIHPDVHERMRRDNLLYLDALKTGDIELIEKTVKKQHNVLKNPL